MSDIPDDIMKAAKAAYMGYLETIEGIPHPTAGAAKTLVLNAFSKAILAERERNPPLIAPYLPHRSADERVQRDCRKAPSCQS